MFLSMNWISDFVDLSGLNKTELIHQFSLSTAEVENEIFFKGSELSGVVVAEIKSVENHPESKKLHLLKVDAGDGQLTDVVCGAPNVRVLRSSQRQSRYENRLCKGRRKNRRNRNRPEGAGWSYLLRYVLQRG